MKQTMKILATIFTTLILLNVTAYSPYIWASQSTVNMEDVRVNEEAIYLYVTCTSTPFGAFWGSNVIFQLMLQPGPLDLTKYESLSSAKYVMAKIDTKHVINMYLSFDPESSNHEQNAQEVSEELLQTFNHTMLEQSIKSGPDYNSETNTIDFFYRCESLPLDLEPVIAFLRHKPTEGFGKLINENFLSLYLPGNAASGISHLKYTWTRTDGSWILTVGGSVSEKFSPTEKTIDLNKLINNNESIMGTTDKSFIKVRLFPTKKYTMSVLDIFPPGYNQTDDWVYEWLLSESVENIVITIKTDVVTEGIDSIIYVVIIVVIASIVIGGGIAYKRKKTK